MEDEDIIKLIDSKMSTIDKIIDEKVNLAIEDRKKKVCLRLKIWSGAITAIFGILLFLGFSKEEMVNKVRESIFPINHIVSELIVNVDESRRLKKNIIAELNDPSLKDYPDVKSSIESNVWETISTKDKKKINSFLENSILDEEIINNYKTEVNALLYSTKLTDKTKRNKKILELGKEHQFVRIGYFENNNNSRTNCNLPFLQDRKRAIIYFPVSSRYEDGSNFLPWFGCPNESTGIVISLEVEDIEVTGIRVVGVERPTKEDYIKDVRARVSKAVVDEFLEKGIALGQHITIGKMKVIDIWE